MTDAIVPVDALEQQRVRFCKQVRQYLATGKSELAYDTAASQIRVFHDSGYSKGEASALLMKALAYANLQLADPQRILTTAHKALFLLQSSEDTHSELETMKLIAQAHVGFRDFELATSTAKDMVQRAKESGDDAAVADATYTLAEVCLANREQDDAVQATKDALSLFQKVGDKSGEARCKVLSSDVQLILGDSDSAMDDATKAIALFQQEGDKRGQACALHRQALAHKHEGSHLESMRAAAKAISLWRESNDDKNMVDGLITECAAKVQLSEKFHPSMLKQAQGAVAMAKKFRTNDPVCLGNALYIQAQAQAKSNDDKGTMMSAQSAARFFRQTGQPKLTAHCQLIYASAAVRMNCYQDAREKVNEALTYFEKQSDEDGMGRALEVEEQVDKATGRPTRKYLAALAAKQAEQQMLMQQQQAYMAQQAMLAAQGNKAAAGAAPMMLSPIDFSQQGGGQQGPPAGAKSGAKAVDLPKGEALDMSAGVDAQAIRNKILEIAAAIIGDADDELEADTPLMEAGLTSNSAVILRDALSKDIPGVSLPPTLIFDYPSVTSMSEFIVEKSKGK